MIYLPANHTTPPQIARLDGKLWPTAPLIANNDTTKLAQLGIYPHHPIEPGIPYPLGKEWVEIDGEWFEETIGTEAEIQSALDAQAAAERRAQWAAQAQARRAREARKTLAEPTSPENFDAKLAAIQALQESV